MSELDPLNEFYTSDRCKPTKRGRLRTSLFVLANTALAASAAYLVPPALAEKEVGNGTTTLAYGQTVENAIGSVCLPLVGKDGYDVTATLRESEIEQDGQTEYLRFSDPHSGATIIVTCTSKEWEVLNNRSVPDIMVAIR